YNPSYQSYSSGNYNNNSSQGYSSYGAGGFMTPGGEGPVSRRDSEGRSSDRGAKTVRSVTIRQLLNCDSSHSDGEQLLDGKPLSLVTFVAKVHNISPKSALVDITVEDGTGFIEVKLFSNNDNLNEEQERIMNVPSDIKINSYIRASGTLKEFKSIKSFIAYSIRPITDHNEISYHFIEVIHTHLSLIKGNNNRMSQGSASTITGSVYDPSQVNKNNSNTGAFTSKLHKEVFDLVARNADNEVGMKIDDICRALAFQYGSDNNVRNAIDDLVSEGQLYNTSDDNHVQVTGAMKAHNSYTTSGNEEYSLFNFGLDSRLRPRIPRNTIINFVPQQEAWIIERFGKFDRLLQPGLAFVIPFLERI
ncbi:7785_t:CDS:2, partial [Acaulospora morrowiae]